MDWIQDLSYLWEKNPFRDFLSCHQMLSQKLLLENVFNVKLKYLYSLKKASTPT